MTPPEALLPKLLDLVAGPLATLLLERGADGSFRQLGPAPAWLPSVVDGPIEHPALTFPFLQSFLDEAAAVWNRGDNGYVRSGYWTQEGTAGAWLHLVARAVRSGRLQLLVIACDEETYRDHQRLAQRGRETTLALEQLNREVQKKEIPVSLHRPRISECPRTCSRGRWVCSMRRERS